MKAHLYAFFALLIVSISSCGPAFEADVTLANAYIAQFDGDSLYYLHGHIAVQDGKILAILPIVEGKNTLPAAKDTVDLQGAYLYPGFIDAHAHFLGQGLAMNSVNLWGAKSWSECVDRVRAFIAEHPDASVIRGRGWDQNDWPGMEYPTLEALEGLTDKPIVLSRIDGHAVVANSVAMELSGITAESRIEGGEILHFPNGAPTGVLIDNAESLLKIAQPSETERIDALLTAQARCYSLGLTSVHDAGLPTEDIDLIHRLQDEGQLTIPLYVMVSESPEALKLWKSRGPLKSDRLDVHSFKFYSDGALGSRGALLRQPYNDRHDHFGLQIRSYDYKQEAAQEVAAMGWQMNTHAIGDSANHFMLELYQAFAPNNSRWRIEHAQIVSAMDRMRFGGSQALLPSVQPTHATSDMDWAVERLGAHRMPDAYAYLELRQAAGGILPLGTDFPVEEVNPLYTLYAATSRKALDGHPSEGFQIENALTRSQALKGMTHDAAYAAFQEEELGEVKSGLWANFTIFTEDLLTCPEDNLPLLNVLQTWVQGACVYTAKP
ncbi:MAG TPA: amidohydrolase [Cryomorphaceae bacterium]|nr:amidohydrolase [Cryomorphaceae bacterium]